MDYLIALNDLDLRAEWAVNEKVALEIAIGHSWAGQRTFSALKMSGLNFAADSLLSLATSGVRGGLVVLVGDDPGVYYGMVEQDSRVLARLAMIPMIEPSTPDEARLMTRDAFDVSERTEAPVLVRQTTTTAVTSAPVNVEKKLRAKTKSSLPNDISRYTKAGSAACRQQHSDALLRLRAAGAAFDYLNVLRPGSSRIGVVAAASVWPYLEECLGELGDDSLNLLKVAVVNPLPDAKIASLVGRCDRVLVVEELEPLIEERVRVVAQKLGRAVEVLGKELIPEVGDLDADLVADALARFLGKIPPSLPPVADLSGFTARKSTFCPGCPHRSTYSALKKGISDAGFSPDEVMVTGDVGCTILGMNEPFSLCRTELVMGASIPMAQGFAYADPSMPVVATIGDSTFYHSGITGLINAASRNINLTVVVLDNDYAAMTGFQPTVSTSYGAKDLVKVRMSLVELAKATKVSRVRLVTPYFTRRLAKMVTKSIKAGGVNVIIAEAPCAAKRHFLAVIPCAVNVKRCPGTDECGFKCLKSTLCPALTRDEATGKALIMKDKCIGCCLCLDFCPPGAIKKSVGLLRRFR